MSDNSRSRVTVTLGRSGRVVKRPGVDGFSDGVSMAGSKRSIRDRLGGNSDDRNQQYNKRHHGESFIASDVNAMHLGKDDLRYKLMQKNMVRESESYRSHANIDLRDKLSSRPTQSSVDSKTMRPLEATASTRYPLPEPRDTGLTRHTGLEPRNAGLLGQIPSMRNSSNLSVYKPVRPYSSWTLENIRRRSPERISRPLAPRGVSPGRNSEDFLRRSLVRAYDDGRSSSTVRISPPRSVRSSPFLTQSSLPPPPPVKPVAPLSMHYPPTTGIVQKIPSMVDEHLSVESLLQSMGLGKYAIYFKAEEIDMKALRQLGDQDLKELGIPMGPRKKILEAVMSRSRRHP